MEEGEMPEGIKYCLGKAGEGTLLMEKERKTLRWQDNMITQKAML